MLLKAKAVGPHLTAVRTTWTSSVPGICALDQRHAVDLEERALCVQPPIYRLNPVLATDGSGYAYHDVSFPDPPTGAGPGQIHSFATWNFQFWYRDPQGGPAGFNFSDGLEVTFCP